MKYLIAYILPLLAWLGLTYGGVWSWSTPILTFVVIPLLELHFNGRFASPSDAKDKGMKQLYNGLIYAQLPILYILFMTFLLGVSTDKYNGFEIAALTLSLGILLGSLGMNLGHELGHRTGRFDRLCAHLFWLPNLYMHFGIEHNLWHHKYVATDEDPASAIEGMSIYRFWLTSVIGNFLTAWKVEQQRMRREDSHVNRMWVILIVEGVYLALIFYLFGMLATALAVVAAVIGFLLLESVNYIEHYGLRRKKLYNGRYELQGP